MINLDAQTAILIDADNVESEYLKEVLEISEYHGALKVCRAYGDWEDDQLKSRCEKIDALKIERVQVNRKGKNATDHHLLVEAGEILGTDLFIEVRVFIIVSGDGDFTSACNLIQERGRQVIVIGNKEKTAKSLKETCGTFYYLEDLNNELKKLRQLHPISPNEVRAFFNPLFLAYVQLTKNDDWVSHSQIGKKLRELVPDYESKFGKYHLSTWLKNCNEYFENKDQMIRKLDPDPELTRFNLLVKAFLKTKSTNDSVSLEQLEEMLRGLTANYESRFGGKGLSKWLDSYPDLFEVHENQVTEKDNWLITQPIIKFYTNNRYRKSSLDSK